PVNCKGPRQSDSAEGTQHSCAEPPVLTTTDPNAIDFDALIGDIAPPGLPGQGAPPASPHQARTSRPPEARDPFGDDEPLLPAMPVSQTPPPARAAGALPADPFAALDP